MLRHSNDLFFSNFSFFANLVQMEAVQAAAQPWILFERASQW